MGTPAVLRSLPPALTALAAFSLGSAAAGEAPAQPSDVPPEVRACVEAYEHAWNTHDAAALAAFFTPDADLLMGNGPRIRGREAIEKAWGTYFERIDPKREGTFTIDSIRLITADVALVDVDTRTGDLDSQGSELPTRLARGTWVVVRQEDEWLITAMRGHPAEGEVRFEPGRDR